MRKLNALYPQAMNNLGICKIYPILSGVHYTDYYLVNGGIVIQDVFITVNGSSSITLTVTLQNNTNLSQVWLRMLYSYVHVVKGSVTH